MLDIGGEVDIIDDSKRCRQLCVIKRESDLLNNYEVVRFIIDSKKDMIKCDNKVKSGLFSPNKDCPSKLSVFFKNSDLLQTLKLAEKMLNGFKIIAYTALKVEKIRQMRLNVRLDNYGYHAAENHDLPNHSSISAFNGGSLKELQKEMKIQSDFSKISS
ncbi:MAG: hypothetical protein LBL00_01285 [Endomicrobium sp.]|jgi:hypothetical protein|nr:hypothetical protein [Endomicrobium sp.]